MNTISYTKYTNNLVLQKFELISITYLKVGITKLQFII